MRRSREMPQSDDQHSKQIKQSLSSTSSSPFHLCHLYLIALLISLSLLVQPCLGVCSTSPTFISPQVQQTVTFQWDDPSNGPTVSDFIQLEPDDHTYALQGIQPQNVACEPTTYTVRVCNDNYLDVASEFTSPVRATIDQSTMIMTVLGNQMTSDQNKYYVTITATNQFGSTNYNVNVHMKKCIIQDKHLGFYNYSPDFYEPTYIEIDPVSLQSYTHTTLLPQYVRYDAWCAPYATEWRYNSCVAAGSQCWLQLLGNAASDPDWLQSLTASPNPQPPTTYTLVIGTTDITLNSSFALHHRTVNSAARQFQGESKTFVLFVVNEPSPLWDYPDTVPNPIEFWFVKQDPLDPVANPNRNRVVKTNTAYTGTTTDNSATLKVKFDNFSSTYFQESSTGSQALLTFDDAQFGSLIPANQYDFLGIKREVYIDEQFQQASGGSYSFLTDHTLTFDVIIYDCDFELVLPTVDASVVTEGNNVARSGFDFSMMLGSGTKSITISAATQANPTQCGVYSYAILPQDASLASQFSYDQSTRKLIVDTDASLGPNISDVQIVAKNVYVQKSLLTINIEVVDCATVNMSSHGGTGFDAILMDFSLPTSAHTIQWNEFTFDNPACEDVDRYLIKCWDPENRYYKINGGGGTAPDSDPGSLCSLFQYDSDSSVRTIILPSSLTSFSEGQYRFKIIGWNQDLGKSNNSLMLEHYGTIQADCDSVSNVVTAPSNQKFSCISDPSTNSFANFDDIHYYFHQSPATLTFPIDPFTLTFSHTCTLEYSLSATTPLIPPSLWQPYISLSTSPTLQLQIGATTNSLYNSGPGGNALPFEIEAKVAGTVNRKDVLAFNIYQYRDCRAPSAIQLSAKEEFEYTTAVSGGSTITRTCPFTQVTPSSDQTVCYPDNQATYVEQKHYTVPGGQDPRNSVNLDIFSVFRHANGDIGVNFIADTDYEVYTQDASGAVVCDLSLTTQCTLELEIYAFFNNTKVVVCEIEATINTECNRVIQYWNAKPFAQKWDWTLLEQAKFSQGYQLRDPLVQLTLPNPILDLASGDPIAKCGFIFEYEFLNNPDSLIFTNFQFDSTGASKPTIDVYSDDQTKLTQQPTEYSQTYTLNLQVKITNYATGWPNYNTDAPNDIQIKLYDECLSATLLTDAEIWHEFSDSTPPVKITGLLPYLPSQHILGQKSFLVVKDQNYFVNGLIPSTSCGPLAVRIVSTDLAVTQVEKIRGVLQGYEDQSVPFLPSNEPFVTESDNHVQPTGFFFDFYACCNGLIGTYTLTFGVGLAMNQANYSHLERLTQIQVRVAECLVEQVVGVDQNFPESLITVYLLDSPKQFSIENFDQIPACNYTFSYEATAEELAIDTQVPLDGSNLPLIGYQPDPALVTFKSQPQNFEIRASLEEQIGMIYAIHVSGGINYPNGPTFVDQSSALNFVAPFKIVISDSWQNLINSPPSLPSLPPLVTLEPSEQKTIYLKQAADSESNPVYVDSVRVDQSWISYANSTSLAESSFEIKAPDDKKEGDFSLSIKICDVHKYDSKCSTISMAIQIRLPQIEEEFKFVGIQGEKEIDLNLPPPIISFGKVNRRGQMRITFSEIILMPKNVTNFTSQNEGQKILCITYEPSENTQEEYENREFFQKMSWSVSGFSPTYIDVEIDFTDPILVSMYPNALDRVKIQLCNPEVFVGFESKKSPKVFQQNIEIPTLVTASKIEQATVKSTEDSFAVALRTIFTGTTLLYPFVSGLLQYLWGMVNALQIIVLTSLFNLLIPANTKAINVIILRLTAFDLFGTEDLYEDWLGLGQDSPSFNQAFEESGFDGSIFIVGIGTLFIIITLQLVFFGLHAVYRKFFAGVSIKNRFLQKVLAEKNYTVIFMVFMYESCMELGLTACVCLIKFNKDRVSTFWEIVSTICTCVVLSILIATPIYNLVITNKFFKKRQDEQIQKKYGPLFKQRDETKYSSVLFSSVFFARRYAMMALLIMGPTLWRIQINQYMLQSALLMSYVAYYRPFKSSLMNAQEVLNEVTVLVSSYTLFCYSDFVSDPYTRYQVGWASIGIILFNLAMNLTLLAHVSGGQVKDKIKFKYRQHKIKIAIQRRLDAKMAQKYSLENLMRQERQIVEEIRRTLPRGQTKERLDEIEKISAESLSDRIESKESSNQLISSQDSSRKSWTNEQADKQSQILKMKSIMSPKAKEIEDIYEPKTNADESLIKQRQSFFKLNREELQEFFKKNLTQKQTEWTYEAGQYPKNLRGLQKHILDLDENIALSQVKLNYDSTKSGPKLIQLQIPALNLAPMQFAEMSSRPTQSNTPEPSSGDNLNKFIQKKEKFNVAQIFKSNVQNKVYTKTTATKTTMPYHQSKNQSFGKKVDWLTQREKNEEIKSINNIFNALKRDA